MKKCWRSGKIGGIDHRFSILMSIRFQGHLTINYSMIKRLSPPKDFIINDQCKSKPGGQS